MKKRNLLLILITVYMILFASVAAGAEADMDMLVINVRKADCILLRSGEDLYMIDTGTAESWGRISAVLKTENIHRLTGVILTHTDGDHAGGLMALAGSDLEIGKFYTSAFYTCKENKHPAMLAAEIRDMEADLLMAGDVLPFGNGSLKVLGPVVPDKAENNNSVVLLAEAGDCSFLLAGDMEFPEEKTLMGNGSLGPVDVLKVANHGESDATGDAFASLVSPRIAVISTNSMDEPDTPSLRVIRALQTAGAEILNTQQAGKGIRIRAEAGKIAYEYLSFDTFPPKAEGIVIREKNIKNDSLTLENTGKTAVDLSGWYVYSERGEEMFVIPEGTVLEAGKQLMISALDSSKAGDLVWKQKKVWHKTKEDCAILCDVYGRIITYN